MKLATLQIDKMHAAQDEILESAKRFNVPCCGRQFGKNKMSHRLCLDGALGACPIAWGAPTYKNLADDWRELTDILAPIIRNKSEQDKRLELITNGVIEMWSLDSPEPIRGRKYKLWIINEAAAVKNLRYVWNQIIRSTLLVLRGNAWFPSTPRGMNYYHDLYTMGLDDDDEEWKSWHYTSYDNPFIHPGELRGARKTMSEEEYREEILAEFLEGAGAVFRGVDEASVAPKSIPREHMHHTLVAGLDWGKQNDFTAISIMCVDCTREVALDRFSQIDYHFQMQRVYALLREWHVAMVRPERNSIGEMPMEALQRKGFKVHPFKTSNVSKTALIENFAVALERGEVELLDENYATEELVAYERKITETGLSKYSAPEGMHDDTVIARALAWQACGIQPKRRILKPNHGKAMEAFAQLGRR